MVLLLAIALLLVVSSFKSAVAPTEVIVPVYQTAHQSQSTTSQNKISSPSSSLSSTAEDKNTVPLKSISASTTPATKKSVNTPLTQSNAGTTSNSSSAATTTINSYGIAAGSGWTFISEAQLEANMQGLNNLGVSWLRFDILWPLVQPQNGNSYDWSKIDPVVAAALQHHIQLLPILDNTPSWAGVSNCGSDDWCQPSNPQAFANFAAAAAARYAPQGVHDWEIWNEENTQGFWQPAPSPVAYTQLLKDTYTAIKGVDPTATVITGGLGGPSGSEDISPLTYLQDLYQDGAQGSFDAVGDHPYSFPVPASYIASWNGWQQMDATPVSLYGIMSSHGDGAKKIWITEYGAPTNGPGAVADVGNYNIANSPRHVTEALQSYIVQDAIEQYQTLPFVGPFFWYSYQDSGTDTSTNENFFGLLRADGSAKPAYNTYQSLIASADQVSYSSGKTNTSTQSKAIAVAPKTNAVAIVPKTNTVPATKPDAASNKAIENYIAGMGNLPQFRIITLQTPIEYFYIGIGLLFIAESLVIFLYNPGLKLLIRARIIRSRDKS